MRREKDARLIHFLWQQTEDASSTSTPAEFRHRLLQMFPGAKQARLKRRQRDPQLVGRGAAGDAGSDRPLLSAIFPRQVRPAGFQAGKSPALKPPHGRRQAAGSRLPAPRRLWRHGTHPSADSSPSGTAGARGFSISQKRSAQARARRKTS